MSKAKIAVGTLIAAVAGFAAGILTAPKSGKETRNDIKIKATEFKDEAAKRADDVKDKVVEVAGDVKKNAESFVHDTRGNAEDLVARTERAAEAAKKGFFSKK